MNEPGSEHVTVGEVPESILFIMSIMSYPGAYCGRRNLPM